MKKASSIFIALFLISSLSSHYANLQADSCSSSLTALNDLFLFDVSSLTCDVVWSAQSYILRYTQASSSVWSFVLSAPNTNGYKAMGFSPNGDMVGSSAIVCWINPAGVPGIKQYYLAAQTASGVLPNEGNLVLVNNTASVLLIGSTIFMSYQLSTISPGTRVIYSVGPAEFSPSSPNYQLTAHIVQASTTMNYVTALDESSRAAPAPLITSPDDTTCARCQSSGGFCGLESNEFVCHCSDGTEPMTSGGIRIWRWGGTKKNQYSLRPFLRRSNLALILGTVVSTAGILVILLFYIIVKKLRQGETIFFWKSKTENYRNIQAFLKNCGSLSPKRYTYSDIKKFTDSFKTKLGQGGSGCVYKGQLENGRLVAVKVLKGLKGNGDEFINEVATISRTSHVHIVSFLGFCFEGRHRALIYEFMPNGSLDKFIHDGASLTNHQLGWEALFQIAVGIARGLEYLHRGCNTRILHFDIKPHNILLNEDFCPKISDFGLAKLCPQKDSIVSLLGTRGTPGYIAPEVFNRNFGGVSHKSDVYSYGMMVLEMIGQRKNNMSVEVDHSSETYFPHWVYKRLELDEELGLHVSTSDEAKTSARKMIIASLWCIQIDPSHRPSMSQVLEMLEGSLESLQIPPKPFLSSPSRAPVDSSTTQSTLMS